MNKNLNYSVYIVHGILVIGFIFAVSSCKDSFENIPVQQPTASNYNQQLTPTNEQTYNSPVQSQPTQRQEEPRQKIGERVRNIFGGMFD